MSGWFHKKMVRKGSYRWREIQENILLGYFDREIFRRTRTLEDSVRLRVIQSKGYSSFPIRTPYFPETGLIKSRPNFNGERFAVFPNTEVRLPSESGAMVEKAKDGFDFKTVKPYYVAAQDQEIKRERNRIMFAMR